LPGDAAVPFIQTDASVNLGDIVLAANGVPVELD
jgi:hypothetical protein